MNAIEEINSMVKSAGKYGNTYAEIYSNFSKMTPEQRRAAIDRQENKSRQQALNSQGALAGRSIGSGYTGNEIRHGGIYATNPRNAPVGPRWQGDYRNLKSTQMMKKWMDAGDPASGGGANSPKWNDYVASSRRNSKDYTPPNPPQYTYSGPQPMIGMPPSAPAKQQATGSSEFGSGFNANRARGTWLNNGRIDGSTAPSQNALPSITTTRTNSSRRTTSSPVNPPVGGVAISPPPPAPTPTSLQVQNPSMYEDVGMDEQGIADNWSRFVPNQPARQPQPRPQPNPSISDEDIADINDYVKNLQNSRDPLVPDATKSTYGVDRYLRANGLDTLEDLFMK